MAENLQEALDKVNLTYSELEAMADDIVRRYSTTTDDIIKSMESIESMSNDDIRLKMTKLALSTYSLSEAKEHASLKSECADTIEKESRAKEFNGAEGTVAVKENISFLNSSNEVIVNVLYESVANLLKVKCDEAHRVVDVLKNILISRNAEAKLASNINDMSEGM